MIDPTAAGRRVLKRQTVLQLAITGILAVVALFWGRSHASGVLLAGVVLTLANLVAARWMFRRAVPTADQAVMAMIVGLLGKWLLIGLALWAAIGPLRLPAIPVLIGIVGALAGQMMGAGLYGTAKQ